MQGIVSQYVQAVFSSYLVLKLMAFDRLDDLLGHVDSKCLLREIHAAPQLQLVVPVRQPLNVVAEIIGEQSKVAQRMLA